MSDKTPAPGLPREAAELILQDEALTSDLEDRDADILLHWALAAASQVIGARVAACQRPDRTALYDAVRPVRLLARSINDLVADYAGLDPHEFLSRLLVLVDAARALAPGRAAENPPPRKPPA